MSEKLEDFDWDLPRMQGGSVEQAEWFNGETWQLTRGEDFEEDLVSFRQKLYGRAKYHGYKLRTRTIEKGKTLVVQAHPLDTVYEGEIPGQLSLFD